MTILSGKKMLDMISYEENISKNYVFKRCLSQKS